MRNGRLVTAIALLVAALGCVGSPLNPQERKATFVLEEYAPYGEDGTATISGSAFLKTRGGDVKLGAGNVVLLQPKTSHSDEWFEQSMLRGRRLTPHDTRIDPYVRETRASATGEFTFRNVPAGSYYVGCLITWETGGGTTGGWAYAQVTVGDGETIEGVVVTR